MKKLFTKIKNSSTTFLRRFPLLTFVIALGILLGLIVLANFIRKPPQDDQVKAPEPKLVETYNIGTAPIVQIQGRVEKTGVITIVAQTSGVVRKINAKPGDKVSKGSAFVSLSTNYQGGNSASVQRQIAQKQYQLSKDTLEQQKELILKQKDLALNQTENTEELRKITDKSLGETREQLSLNENILSTINANLTDLEDDQEASPSAATEALILNTKQLKSQYLSASNQLRQLIRANEYQVDTNQEPTKLSQLQKDVAIKQLEIQEKSLQLNHEVSYLSLRLAQISESLMYPAAPFKGTVERVHVKVGEVVNPGDPLISFTGNKQHLTVVATVPESVARSISPIDASTISINEEQYSAIPLHISTEATADSLFSIIYDIPDHYASQIADNSVVKIKVPIGFADTAGAIPAVPIDIIYQLQDTSYIYVVQDGKAVAKEVKLGQIYGSQVQILEGLESGETVIMNRNVIEGDLVKLS